MRWIAVSLLVVLAGCSEGSGTATTDDGREGAAPVMSDGVSAASPSASMEGGLVGAESETQSWDGSTLGSICAWTEPFREGCFGVHSFPENVMHDLRLPAGTASASLTFTWTAADLRTERLTAVVERESGGTQEAEGPSPLAFDLDNPAAGTIRVYLYAPRLAGLPVQAHDPQEYRAEATFTSASVTTP